MTLLDRFVPPDVVDPVERLRARLCVAIPIPVSMATFATAFVQHQNGIEFTPWVLSGCGVAGILTVLLLRRRALLSFVLSIELGLYVVGATVVSYVNGGLRAPIFVTIALVPALAMLVDGKRGAVIWSLVVAMAIGVLNWLHRSGHTPPRSVTEEQFPAVMSLVVVGMTGLTLAIATVYELMKARSLRELETARRHAENLTRIKGEFLANMSHEIRTPLNGILGMLEILGGTDLTARQKEHLETILGSSKALRAIVDDVLDLSKLDAGRVEIESLEFDLRAAVEQIAANHAKSAHAKNVELVVRLAPGASELVTGDPQRLGQVLTNLISNAIKFTSAGEVALEVEPDPKRPGNLCFSVSDTGVGIREEDRVRLFDPFTQADSSTSRQYGGTGLGLTISARLTTLMGGSLQVESVFGEGSLFHFSVPLSPRKRRETRRGMSNDVVRIGFAQRSETGRRVGRELLDQSGVSYAEAADYDAAAGLLRDHGLHALIIDLGLLDPDRAIRMENLRALASLGNTRLIALSSVLERNSELRSVGFDAVVFKPVRKAQLQRSLMPDTVLTPAMAQQRSERRSSGEIATINHRGTILIAEDNPTNEIVIRSHLRTLGFEPVIVNNGAEAIARLTQPNEFRMIFMDCQMPILDGYETTKRVRQREAETGSRRLPIVALTAHATDADRRKAKEAGMDDYLAKPFTNSDLRSILDNWHGETEPTSRASSAP